MNIEALEKEYKRFIAKLRVLDPSCKYKPWTARPYCKRRGDTQESPAAGQWVQELTLRWRLFISKQRISLFQMLWPSITFILYYYNSIRATPRLLTFDPSLHLYSPFQQRSLVSVMNMPVTAVGGKVRETFQASGQDVPAPQTGRVLPAIQRPCFITKNQKPHMQSVRIRTSLSLLITQGWRWPLQRSGDCRST